MTRLLAWVAGVLSLVVVGTGLWATFRYRPDATGVGLGLQRLHALAGIALAAVLVLGLAALVWERRPDRRHGLPAFVVVAVLAVVLVLTVVGGRRLAWDQLVLGAVPDDLDAARGVLLGDVALRFVVSDAREIAADDFRRQVWLHVLVLPVVTVLGAGFVVWWTRRHARPEARPTRTSTEG